MSEEILNSNNNEEDQNFYDFYNTISPEAKEYLSAISISLIENDIFEKVNNSTDYQKEIKNTLISLGINNDKLELVFNHFGIQNPNKEDL